MQTIPKTNFHIQTDAYQGPFELVLDLIEKRKLLVNDLALASITEDFVNHVHAQEAFPMEEAAQFIGIAATLLLIKSKSLIPDLTLTEEEQEDVDDLKRRLEAYEKVRQAARELGRLFGKQVMLPPGVRAPEPFFAPSRDLTTDALSQALAKLLTAQEEAEKLPEARVKPTMSIEEVMDDLSRRVQSAMTLSFKEFTGGKKEKVDVIVSFLALLELVKQGALAAEQYEQHGDIRIKNTDAEALPRYE